jgi:peptide/nickel transport system substrate-binding protein
MNRFCFILAIVLPSLLVAEGKSVVVSSGQKDIVTMSELDPHEVSNEYLSDIVRNIYDTLYDIQADGSITESLAEHCDVKSFQESVDYNLEMEIICKIRDGVFFHDGVELRPNDVVFSVLRAKNSKTLSSNFSFIKDAQVVPTDSVRFILSYNSGGVDNAAAWLFEKFKRALARYAYIVRADYFTGGAGWALEYPIGTGPFYFKDWKLWDSKDSRSQIILSKNKSYWRPGYPILEEVLFRFLPNKMWLSSLKDGSVSLLYRIPYSDYTDLYKANFNKGFFKLSKRLEYSYQYLVFTPNSKIFKSVDVKRAFFSGISREKIVKHMFGKNAIINSGRALYAGSVFPEKFPVLPYRPELSRNLVSSYLRMKGHKGSKFPVFVLASDRLEDIEAVSEIEKQLIAAGFDPKINIVELKSYRMLLNKGDLNRYDLVLYSVNEPSANLSPKARTMLKNGGLQLYQRHLFYAMSRTSGLSKFYPPAEGPLRLIDAE